MITFILGLFLGVAIGALVTRKNAAKVDSLVASIEAKLNKEKK